MKLLITLLLCMLLIGCARQETIKIGGLFQLTGDGAFWGSGERNGAQMAVDQINAAGGIQGKKIELVVEDGRTNPVAVLSATKKLIEVDDVQVIIGPTWFGQIVAPIAESSHVVAISPSTGVTLPRERYFFNLWSTEQQEVSPLLNYLQKRNQTRIAIVFTQNDWSVSMKDHFVEEAKKRNISVVDQFEAAPNEVDFKTIIAQLKELDIDGVYGAFAFYPAQGYFTRQAKELQLQPQIYSTSDTQIPQLLEAFPEIEGTIYTYPDSGDEAFEREYETRYGVGASPSSAYAYDAVQLAAAAMRSNATTSQQIATYLENVREYRGKSNVITFENGRVVAKSHSVKQVLNGEFVFIK